MQDLTELYCLMDDFCQAFEPAYKAKQLESGDRRKRNRQPGLSLAELMTIMVLFHQIRYRQFKVFYLHYVYSYLRREFPRLPSYQRIVELMPRCAVALAALFEVLKGQCSGISIADSTPLCVCNNLRIRRHKVFAGMAKRGKSSTGWFFGFKLHVVINHVGELLKIKLTPGNVDDRKALKQMLDCVCGKLFADKGYIAQWLTDFCKQCGVDLITKVRRNMKPIARSPFDRAVLQGRSLIETVFDELKNLCQIEHTRHRSPLNFVVNLLAGVLTYCLFPYKPRLAIKQVENISLIPN
jgi:transposase